jgi:dinuclear metal center YbgI/SA1388 family protein
MYKISEIYKILDEISPFELQEKWDNSGLNVGSFNDEVEDIILSMDMDEELLESLSPNTLLITHHPLIFGSLKNIDYDSYPAKFIKMMIKKDISHIALHTNFDKSDLNRYVAENIFKAEILEEEEFVVYFDVDMSFDEFAVHVKQRLDLDYIKAIKTNNHVKRVALTTGSGASLLNLVKCDCFLTGDIKFHDAMLAKALGISMLDITHFDSEKYFTQALSSKFEKLDIKHKCASSKDPFVLL